jgi:plastocyanin domain-containing protein
MKPLLLLATLLLAAACQHESRHEAQTATAPPPAPLAARADEGVQTVDLKIVNGEYQPATISVREGLPVRLNVTRDEHSACGEVLVIAAHNVKQTIPVNQPTTIEFTPAKAGELEFTCGMDMMKGKIVVTGAGA